MTAILTPIDKTTQHTPVWLSARLTVPRGLGKRQHQRTKVNDLSSLWPEGYLREVVMRNAQKFITDMALQGYDLLSAEGDVVVTGPFESRRMDGAARGIQKGQRHVLRGPAHNRQPVQVDTIGTFGRHIQQRQMTDTEDYVIEARFLSRRVTLVEHQIPTGKETL